MSLYVRKFVAMIVLAGTLLGTGACASKPVELNFSPDAGAVKANQYSSSLRIAFVNFEDIRAVPAATGDLKMVGWGANTYSTNVDVSEHVTRAFVDEYRYLGFNAIWIKSAPSNFSFSTKDWVRTLRTEYPNVDVFVIGKIRDYQFLLRYGSMTGVTGKQAVSASVGIQTYFVDSQTGKVLWGDLVRHTSFKTKLSKKEPTLYAAIRLDDALQNVILQTVDRSLIHINRAHPDAVHLQSTGMAEISKTPEGKPAGPLGAGKGRLNVFSKPSEASVYVDGVYYGTTPLTLDLSPGIHLLKVKKDGFETRRDKVGIIDGKETPWRRVLPAKN